LGLALSLYDEITVSVTSGGLSVLVEGEGAGEVPLDESHLIVRTMREAFAAMDAAPGGLLLHCANAIPHARGLGSSSAAIVAGLWAARACVVDGDERLDDHDLLAMATRIEGHPDNVAPCLLGGATIAVETENGVTAVSRPPVPSITAVAFVPQVPVSTELARGLLPDQVPLHDAVFNVGRSALLVDALLVDDGRAAQARLEQLMVATDDRLHQPYRAGAMGPSADLVGALRAAGTPAFISGAGPTVLALVVEGADVPAPDPVEGFEAHALTVDVHGAVVTQG
jgi:homoserine kinase